MLYKNDISSPTLAVKKPAGGEFSCKGKPHAEQWIFPLSLMKIVVYGYASHRRKLKLNAWRINGILR